jgi:hypothetical protein
MMKDLCFCTIASKNHLARVRVLTESLLAHHPDAEIFWLAVDSIENFVDPSKEKMKVIKAHTLKNVPNITEMFFKYNAFEASTAFKPFFIEYLLTTYNMRKLVYLDSDIYVTMNMDELSDQLRKFAIILTPHITKQLSLDDHYSNELLFLKYGIFNLGFIAIANVQEALNFLSWWKKRLWHFGLMNPAEGMGADQKWIDFVPYLFEKVHILKHPGYNVAFWNLHERRLSFSGRKILVNGELLRFFHFNSFYPDNFEAISKYQYRHRLISSPVSRYLLKLYKNILAQNGYNEICKWPYSYNFFDNGVEIPDRARRVYWELGNEVKRFGNPFETSKRNSFYEYYLSTVSTADKWIYRIISFGKKYEKCLRRFSQVEILAKKSLKFLTWLRS